MDPSHHAMPAPPSRSHPLSPPPAGRTDRRGAGAAPGVPAAEDPP